MSRAKKTPRTHYTHHACMESGMWRSHVQNDPRNRHPERFHGRSPDLKGCHLLAKPDRFTTDRSRVTCAVCVERADRDTHAAWQSMAALRRDEGRDSDARYYANWRDDRTLIKVAWKRCCRHLGTPWPLTADEHEEERRKDLAERVLLPTLLFAQEDEIGAAVEKLAGIDESLVDALRPAIDACTMASDLLVEVRRLYASAETHIEHVKEQILSGQIRCPATDTLPNVPDRTVAHIMLAALSGAVGEAA